MFVVGPTPLVLTAARSFVIVVKILREDGAREKKNTNRTLGRTTQHNFIHIENHPQVVVHTFHHSTLTNVSLSRHVLPLCPQPRMSPSHHPPKYRHSREHRTPDLELGRHRFLIEAMIQRRHRDVSMWVSTQSMMVCGLSLVTTRPPIGRTISLGQLRSYKSLIATTLTKHRNGVFVCLQRGIGRFELS